jgi:hypothetical protein
MTHQLTNCSPVAPYPDVTAYNGISERGPLSPQVLRFTLQERGSVSRSIIKNEHITEYSPGRAIIGPPPSDLRLLFSGSLRNSISPEERDRRIREILGLEKLNQIKLN